MLGAHEIEQFNRFIESGQNADLFMTPEELLQADNYLRAFEEELNILGEDHDDEAVKAAKEREPEGFKASMKYVDMMRLFFDNEGKDIESQAGKR